MNLLFVCQANAQRSPSFEAWFKKNRAVQHEVRSAGISFGYPYQIVDKFLPDTLEWADVVYCMDLEQERWIARRYPEYFPKIKTIGVSDQYPRESPQINRVIEYWVERESL